MLSRPLPPPSVSMSLIPARRIDPPLQHNRAQPLAHPLYRFQPSPLPPPLPLLPPPPAPSLTLTCRLDPPPQCSQTRPPTHRLRCLHVLRCNFFVLNKALSIFIDALLPAWGAILISVTLVLAFGEIFEAMDISMRQGLLNSLVGKVGKRMDTLLVPLELLCCISRTDFPDKKAYIRRLKRQLNMLEDGLINHPVVGFGESGRKASEVRILLAKIEESESLPSSTGELQLTKCLRSLREVAIPLAERPARGDITGEICHWADGYHLNVRLYEKVLPSVFDVLDEGKLIEVNETNSKESNFCLGLHEHLFRFFFLHRVDEDASIS